jgi:hypothetical protein
VKEQLCLFCGEPYEGSLAEHLPHCDGKQGHVEALDLSDAPESRARHTDPETSHAAAACVNELKIDGRILAALKVIAPASSEGVSEYTGLRLVVVSPRFKPLESIGLVRRATKVRNHSGCWAIGWALTDKAS